MTSPTPSLASSPPSPPDRFHHAHPVTAAQVAAELARELEQRRRFYPRRIADGAMTQAEADHELAVAAAWVEDVARIESRRFPTAGRGGEPAHHGLSWHVRRKGLARELGLRARVYPRRVGDGAMTREDAAHRAACLAALSARYDGGWDWLASNGLPPPAAHETGTDADRARREWTDHLAALAAATPDRQEEMAL